MIEQSRASPWDAGIVDTLVGARVVLATNIPHKNRLAVILMDSAFETTCRAFLKHKKKIKLSDAHKTREILVKATRANLKDVEDVIWERINYYYEEIRNDFYHESAGKTITDAAFSDYKNTIESVIARALEIEIAPMILNEFRNLKSAEAVGGTPFGTVTRVGLRGVSDPVSKVIVGIATVQPRSVKELNEFFKREGDSLRLKPVEFTNIVARNSGSKRFFYYSREQRVWGLSTAGHSKLNQISSTEGNA